MSSKKLEQLLQTSKILYSSSNGNNSSQIKRGITQIGAESNVLNEKLGVTTVNDRGHYLLAQSGSNTQEISENLANIDTRITFQPSELSTDDLDVESYLDQARERGIRDLMKNIQRDTSIAVGNNLRSHMHSKSKKCHRRILEEWDNTQENKLFGRNMQASQQNDHLKNQVAAYANVIEEINQSRLLSDKIPVIARFRSLSIYSRCDIGQGKTMDDVWDLASVFASESAVGNYIQNPYSFKPKDAYENIMKKRSLISSAKKYLEKEYVSYINEYLQECGREAKVGGIPSLEHRIYAFMKAKFSKNSIWEDTRLEIQEDKPIWLYTYLLMRNGKLDKAQQFVQENNHLFREARGFSDYFNEYATSEYGLVSDDTSKQILYEYQQLESRQETTDPYKIILYRIIGRCELDKLVNKIYPNKSSPVVQTINDFLWFLLTLVREQTDVEKYSYERYRLSDVQTMILEKGPQYFNLQNSNPWKYAKILLLSLQFERAVGFLYSAEAFRVETVHLGIALAYHNLLQAPKEPINSNINLLIPDMNGSVGFNLCCLVSQYVRLFLDDDSNKALQYFYLVSLLPTEDMMELCYEQVANFIARKNYKAILGSVDGTTQYATLGSIEKYKPLLGIDSHNDAVYNYSVLNPVAEKFQEEGKYKDAIAVYQISGQYTRVFQVLVRQLDIALNRPTTDLPRQHQLDSDLINYCTSVGQNYRNIIDFSDNGAVLESLNVLFSYLQAVISYETGNYGLAVEFIKKARVLPEGNDESTRAAIHKFNNFADFDTRKHTPKILEIVMDSYEKLYISYSHSNNPSIQPANQSLMKIIRAEVDAIIRFVAAIDYDIPPKIVQKLNKSFTSNYGY